MPTLGKACSGFCALFALGLVLLHLTAATGPAAAQSFLPGNSEPATEVPADPLQPLLDAIEDPTTRDRLIEALRSANEEPADGTDAAVAEPEERALAARLAETSVEAVEGLVERGGQVLSDISRLGLLPSLLDEERLARIRQEGARLILTILVTVAVYRALRLLSRQIHLRRSRAEVETGTLVGTFIAQLSLRLISVIVAWLAGYGIATFLLGNGTIALAQALYLNAFLVFGLFSIALSVLVSRYPEDVTFARLPPRTMGTIFRNVRRTFGILFYGLIAAVPIMQEWTNFVIARSLRTALITLAALMALWTVRRISRTLLAERKAAAMTALEERRAETGDDTLTDSFIANSINLWDRIWPLLAYAYVVVAYVVAIANPNLIVELVGRATALSALALVAILIGLRQFAMATRDLKMPVPAALEEALPSFKSRLSSFLPAAAVLAGLASISVALLLIVDGWKLVDVGAWLTNGGNDLIWRIASVLIILTVLVFAWSLLSSWIDKRLNADVPGRQVSARSRTLLALFRNALSIALIVFGGMTALSEIGIDIAPLLAGAGVIGLAIGFGAQKLVQDIITGIFIQLENAINEGDVVTVAGITGAVERLTIRSVGIRDLSGVYHLIPFSAVDTVGNYMRLFAYHVEVVGIAYDSNIDTAEKAMHDAFDTVKAGPLGAEIIAPLEYHGVVGLAESSVNLRARVKTKPGQQWAVGRAYTREVKRALDAAGVEIPFPHRELKLPKIMLDRLSGQNEIGGTGPAPSAP
ncbi:MAG: mechanosensitive ion channel domain-containing protein [Pseudomonadota bacterium]